MEDFTKQTKAFEIWVISQFPGQFTSDILIKGADGAYEDTLVSAMFIGFCAGWVLKK